MVCYLLIDSFFIVIILILRVKSATKTHDDILQAALCGGTDFPVEQELTFCEQLSLPLHFLLLLVKLLEFRSVLEFLWNTYLLDGLIHLRIKLLGGHCLHFSYLLSVKELSWLRKVWWIAEAQVWEQFEVHKFHESNIELSECADYLVVNVERQPLVEGIWSNPCDILAHNLHLLVNTLDAEKALLEWLRNGAVCLPFSIKSLAGLNVFSLNL